MSYARSVYYRYEDGSHYTDQPPTVWLRQFVVSRHTPKGAWLLPDYFGAFDPCSEKFVLNGEGKRYAYPTKELALNSYRIRKEYQIAHLAIRHEQAIRQLALATNNTPDTIEPSYAGETSLWGLQ